MSIFLTKLCKLFVCKSDCDSNCHSKCFVAPKQLLFKIFSKKELNDDNETECLSGKAYPATPSSFGRAEMRAFKNLN